MGAYDSDSSGDEDNDYTQTNVVLGFAAKDPADESDTISHLGGRPVSDRDNPCLREPKTVSIVDSICVREGLY
jgi:hypothetical protein